LPSKGFRHLGKDTRSEEIDAGMPDLVLVWFESENLTDFR
jgi:hypothetical protein